jgi:hypothetical protein
MTEVRDAVAEILSAAEQFLDEGEYEKVAIQSNRLLTISAVWAKLPMASNVAVALRLASQDLAIASAADGKVDISQKQEFERLLAGLRSCLDGDDFSVAWIKLSEFKATFWAKSRGALEGRAYSHNEALVDEVLKWARDSLQKNWELVNAAKGSPFAGVANEVDWVVRAFGANPRQIASYAVVCSLAWQAEYERWKAPIDGTGQRHGPPSTAFRSIVERSLKVIPPQENQWNELGAVLADIMGMWRSDFSTFFDFFVAQQQQLQRSAVTAPEGEPKSGRKGFRKERLGKGA